MASIYQNIVLQRAFILLPLFFFLMASPVRSQDKYLLKISGKVIDKKSRDKIEGVRLTLYIDNALVDEKITTKNGKFNFDLKLNTLYVLQATKQSYINSKYEFNTNVPQDVGPESGIFWRFPCDIALLPSFGDMKSKKLLSKVGYEIKNNRFDYDAEYTAVVKSNLESSYEQLKAKKLKKPLKMRRIKNLPKKLKQLRNWRRKDWQKKLQQNRQRMKN